MVTFTSPMVQLQNLGASLNELVGLPALGLGTYTSSNVYRSTAPVPPNWLVAAELLQREMTDAEVERAQDKLDQHEDK